MFFEFDDVVGNHRYFSVQGIFALTELQHVTYCKRKWVESYFQHCANFLLRMFTKNFLCKITSSSLWLRRFCLLTATWIVICSSQCPHILHICSKRYYCLISKLKKTFIWPTYTHTQSGVPAAGGEGLRGGSTFGRVFAGDGLSSSVETRCCWLGSVLWKIMVI